MSGDTSLPENATVEGGGVSPNDDTENITSGQIKNIIEMESAYREEDDDEMSEIISSDSDSDSEVESNGQRFTLTLIDDSE